MARKFSHFISIHALREEGDEIYAQGTAEDNISIHALREEGDTSAKQFKSAKSWISIHALREEGDFACAVAIIL